MRAACGAELRIRWPQLRTARECRAVARCRSLRLGRQAEESEPRDRPRRSVVRASMDRRRSARSAPRARHSARDHAPVAPRRRRALQARWRIGWQVAAAAARHRPLTAARRIASPRSSRSSPRGRRSCEIVNSRVQITCWIPRCAVQAEQIRFGARISARPCEHER